MAGSRKDVNYVADDGSIYAIQVDESNVELVMGSSVAMATSPNRKPSNLRQLRSVVLSDITGLVKRTVPVLTQARYNALNNSTSFTLPSNDADSGTTVGVSEKLPEKFVRLPKSFDTGKTDGDAT
jgi:hypothetical protein